MIRKLEKKSARSLFSALIPYINTFTQNHTVECCWPEVNHDANYPIKSCLIQMQDRGDFDLDSMTHKYCVSWVTLHVSTVGVRLFTGAWNCHDIPGL